MFNDLTNGIAQLDVNTGNTTPVGSFDPSAGVIQGAPATPEPFMFTLLGGGYAGWPCCGEDLGSSDLAVAVRARSSAWRKS